MKSKPKILFRADGHSKMGLGHVSRSLALVQMLNDEFECHFAIRKPLSILQEQIDKVCTHRIDLSNTDNDLQEAQMIASTYLSDYDIIVTDGYHFTTDYQKALKTSKCKLVCIDDIYAFHFVADMIINHAPDLTPQHYSSEDYTKHCLGLDYSLLRADFLNVAQQTRNIEIIEDLFICLGGADFNNITLKILKIIASGLPQIKTIRIVLGGANDFRNNVKNYANSIQTLNIEIYESQSVVEMVTLMRKSHLAIVPASSILYEVVAVKMPVISGFYVDNQINVYHGFKSLELIYGVGDLNKFEDYHQKISYILKLSPKDIILRQQEHLRGDSNKNFLRVFQQLLN